MAILSAPEAWRYCVGVGELTTSLSGSSSVGGLTLAANDVGDEGGWKRAAA